MYFGYDASGQRTFKKSSQRENLYYDKMWQVDVTGRNNIEYKNIYLGKDRLLTKMGNETYHNASDNSYQRINQYYNHANHIGSVNVISDYQGKEFKYVEYTPYGEEWFSETSNLNSGAVGPDGLEYGFTDHLHDEETGLIYANARYLDPKTSRWMSSDPAMGEYLTADRENAPGMGGVFNSRNLQTYHYAGNNPIKYVDPTGSFAMFIAGVYWGGALAGLAFGVVATLRGDSPDEVLTSYFNGWMFGMGAAGGTALVVKFGVRVFTFEKVSKKTQGVIVGTATFLLGLISEIRNDGSHRKKDQRIEGLTQENGELKQENGELKQENSELKQENSELKQEYDEFKAKFDEQVKLQRDHLIAHMIEEGYTDERIQKELEVWDAMTATIWEESAQAQP